MSKGLYVKIGDKFKIDGNLLKCVEDKTDTGNCSNCYYDKTFLCFTFQCSSNMREDGKSVYAKVIRRKKEIDVEKICDKLINRYSNKDTIKCLKLIKKKFKEFKHIYK